MRLIPGIARSTTPWWWIWKEVASVAAVVALAVGAVGGMVKVLEGIGQVVATTPLRMVHTVPVFPPGRVEKGEGREREIAASPAGPDP